MRMKSFQVQSYKSITDSDLVKIEDQVTCLVGKNESGKTATLEALYRLNPISSGLRTGFEELYDYPRRRRALDEEEIPKTTPIVAVFELDDDEMEAVEHAFGKGVLKSRELTVDKSYANSRTWHLWLSR